MIHVAYDIADNKRNTSPNTGILNTASCVPTPAMRAPRLATLISAETDDFKHQDPIQSPFCADHADILGAIAGGGEELV